MHIWLKSLVVAGTVALWAPCAAAQSAPPAKAPAQPDAAKPAAAQPETEKPAGAEPYLYQADGRRDPFMTLLGTGPEPPKAPPRKLDGLPGLGANDISVRGVMQSRGALVAMIEGPDNRTYIVHMGDKLMDATIKSITTQGLVMTQDVEDPLSPQKHREVRKVLRSVEDSKE